MITTKIYIKPHLSEYVIAKYGNKNGNVRFPDKLDIYHFIWDLIQPRPNICQPDFGNIEIILPERSIGKSPRTYNYLSKRAQKIIEKKIENMFFAELRDYVIDEKQRKGTTYIDSIYFFMSKYVINSISEDALKKSCYRYLRKISSRNKRGYKRKKMFPI